MGAVADIEAGRADVDEEGGDPLALAARRLIDAGRREHNGEIGHHRTRDEVLRTVENPVLAVTAGIGLHAHHVGARIGLGQCEEFALFAPRARIEITFLLVAFAGEEKLRWPRHPRMQSVTRLAVFALHQRLGLETQAAAAHLLRQIGGIEARRHGALLDLTAKIQRNLSEPVDQVLVGVQLRLHEGPHSIEQEPIFVGTGETHAFLRT